MANVNSNKIWCILPAAGAGKRYGNNKKIYEKIGDKTIIEHSANPFLQNEKINKIIIALKSLDSMWTTTPLANNEKIITVSGGKTRAESVFNSMNIMKKEGIEQDDWVIVHDAARPCLSELNLRRFIKYNIDDQVGGIMATPLNDTLKAASSLKIVIQTIPREDLWKAETPQMFRFSILFEAISKCIDENKKITDESSAVETLGYRPRIFESIENNIKITYKKDLNLAKRIIEERNV
ncbi:MAG: 2-C-methyl-D-erythritol 4-phosphate cytidylyltransferase [Gammaproteobacteria bacterium]|nr:2-C-methyl-D-erythritol 4-phosphate cytidylyltransferase [Gammaproteobacteria bacterium]|tara:strand:+ start:2722 stop:3432 length:711 start_codon:yes stop_codon:yes gene_type:complete